MERKDNSGVDERTNMSAKVIKLIRENRKLSSKNFSRKLEIKEETLIDLELGEKPITRAIIDQLDTHFVLTEGEKLLLNMAYEIAYPKEAITPTIIEYVINNDLIETLDGYIEIDPSGDLLKEKTKEGKR